MKQLFKLISIMLIAMGLIGCGSNSNTTKKSETSAPIPSQSFNQTTGSVIDETTLSAGDSKSTETTVVIPASTTFVTDDNEPVAKAPVLNTKTEESKVEASTKISFQVDGKNVRPTEPIKISIPAPKGAKPGDTVQVDIPDSAKAAKSEITKRLSKVISLTVSADGTVSIMVNFTSSTTITITVTLLDKSTN